MRTWKGISIANLLSTLVLVGIVVAIAIPGFTCTDCLGKSQVSEAYGLLKGLSPEVEHFFKKNGRFPDVSELSCAKSGEYVDRIFGANPYYAEMKLASVYPKIRGGTVGWWYDEQAATWDKCTLGSISLRFKSLKCREAARTRHQGPQHMTMPSNPKQPFTSNAIRTTWLTVAH